MKIAIGTQEDSIESVISDRGGRAPFYLLFDDHGEHIETLPNPFAVGGGGAGFSVAKMLADNEVTVCIVGAIGENMARALEERGVKYEERTGGVREAAEEQAHNTEG